MIDVRRRRHDEHSLTEFNYFAAFRQSKVIVLRPAPLTREESGNFGDIFTWCCGHRRTSRVSTDYNILQRQERNLRLMAVSCRCIATCGWCRPRHAERTRSAVD